MPTPTKSSETIDQVVYKLMLIARRPESVADAPVGALNLKESWLFHQVAEMCEIMQKYAVKRDPGACIVVALTLTSDSEPQTYEGWTADDRPIHIIFTRGILSVRLGEPGDQSAKLGAVRFSKEVGTTPTGTLPLEKIAEHAKLTLDLDGN